MQNIILPEGNGITCPRARKQKIMQEFDWRICAHALGRGRERKGEACLLTLHLLELDIQTPGHGLMRGRGLTRGRDLTRDRGGARCATGKNGGFPLAILKPRAEGYETEILANLAFRGLVNRIMCMRKPQALNALTVWVFASDETRNSMALHREENKVPLRQSPKCRWMITEDKLGQKFATTKGNVTAL